MPLPLYPLPSIPFGETPVYGTLAIFKVIFVLSLVIVPSLLPVELSNTMHAPTVPFPFIDLAVEPGILSSPMELVVLESTSVVFRELGLANVLEEEIRVVDEGSGFDRSRFLPRILLFEQSVYFFFKIAFS
jgi:hypothetical protein